MLNLTEPPIDDCVIDRVEEMKRSDNQPIMNNGYPIFKWAPGVPILDNDDDDDILVDALEQVAYGVHEEPDNEYDKDNEDTGEDG